MSVQLRQATPADSQRRWLATTPFYESHGFVRDGAERREEVWADLLEVRYRR